MKMLEHELVPIMNIAVAGGEEVSHLTIKLGPIQVLLSPCHWLSEIITPPEYLGKLKEKSGD